jgi:hypothetical protein
MVMKKSQESPVFHVLSKNELDAYGPLIAGGADLAYGTEEIGGFSIARFAVLAAKYALGAATLAGVAVALGRCSNRLSRASCMGFIVFLRDSYVNNPTGWQFFNLWSQNQASSSNTLEETIQLASMRQFGNAPEDPPV